MTSVSGLLLQPHNHAATASHHRGPPLTCVLRPAHGPIRGPPQLINAAWGSAAAAPRRRLFPAARPCTRLASSPSPLGSDDGDAAGDEGAGRGAASMAASAAAAAAAPSSTVETSETSTPGLDAASAVTTQLSDVAKQLAASAWPSMAEPVAWPSMADSVASALPTAAARRTHQALGPYLMAAPKRGVIGNSPYADRLRRSIVKAAKDKDGQK